MKAVSYGIAKLRNNIDFRSVINSGNKVFFEGFILIFSIQEKSNSLNDGVNSLLRFGVIASKKVGGAVIRNRCKRILRSLMRDYIAHFFSQYFYDVVLIARKNLKDLSRKSLIRSIKNKLPNKISNYHATA